MARKITFRSLLPLLLTPLLLLIPISCGDVQREYSTKPCYFVFDNLVHNDATIASAMTPYSGVFTTVTHTMRGGAHYFVFTSNQGTSSEKIFNAIDLRRTLKLGMNNGLIVGYGKQTDPIFYAYDRECPNCFDDSRVPIRSHPLQMTSNGMAVCKTCHREYDMNYGGHIIKGDGGKKMERYPASTSGPNGELKIINMI